MGIFGESPKALGRPWLSRINYFENKRQNLSSHLELVVSESSQSYAFYLSKQALDDQKKITRLLFSITGNRHRQSGPKVYPIRVKEGNSPHPPRLASPNTLYTTIITNITGQRREERGVESSLWVLLSKFVKKKSPLFIAITQAKSTRTSIRQQSYQRRDT